jgi:hypothetical protein
LLSMTTHRTSPRPSVQLASPPITSVIPAIAALLVSYGL